VLDRDPVTGKMSVLVGLEQTPELGGTSWTNVVINGADVFIEGGKVRVDITPSGSAAFYRVQGSSEE
jgi:hypothetical protein